MSIFAAIIKRSQASFNNKCISRGWITKTHLDLASWGPFIKPQTENALNMNPAGWVSILHRSIVYGFPDSGAYIIQDAQGQTIAAAVWSRTLRTANYEKHELLPKEHFETMPNMRNSAVPAGARSTQRHWCVSG